ncbi:MAG: HEPN domain-containing protein [Chloroflexi bacterium]|nr:HEPN domain-containing protein [Chloroflexota bacterium]
MHQTRREPPRTHSLRQLVELCDLPDNVLEYALDLDGYYLSLRYPDVSEDLPYELCDEDDADHGLTQAHNLLTAVEAILKA